MPLNLALVGARGRMGQAITTACADFDAKIVWPLDLGDDIAAGIQKADAVIDFSSHKVTHDVAKLAAQFKKPLVIGTTGHPAEEKQKIIADLSGIPVVWSGNYSVGVNLLFALTRRAASVLGSDYDAEIVEMHHRFKKDAPSGTAARLLEIVLDERKLAANAVRHGRSGITGERTNSEVGMHALRGGDVVGDHTVIFAALGERVELSHKASDRGIFARGALRAVLWVAKKAPGLYDMQDVLGLK